MHVCGSQVARYRKKTCAAGLQSLHVAGSDHIRAPDRTRDAPGQKQRVLFVVFRAAQPGNASEQQRSDQQYGQERHSAHGFVHRSLAVPRLSQRDANDWLPSAGRNARSDVADRRGRPADHAPPRCQHHALVPFPATSRSDSPARLSRRRGVGRLEACRIHLRTRGCPTRPAVTIGCAAQRRGKAAAARPRGDRGAVCRRLASRDQPGRRGEAARYLALTRAAAAQIRSGLDISGGAERTGVRERPQRVGEAAASGCT